MQRRSKRNALVPVSVTRAELNDDISDICFDAVDTSKPVVKPDSLAQLMEQVGVTSKPAAKPAPQFTAEDVTDAPAAPCEGSPARLAGDAGDQVRFMLAGKALVTVVSLKTGDRYTYKISKAPDGGCHFVGLLTGPNNEQDYKFFGIIKRGVFYYSDRKAKIGRDNKSVQGFDWMWRNLARGADISSRCEIWHEGRCGRCARTLTVPDSIRTGFGPECAGKI